MGHKLARVVGLSARNSPWLSVQAAAEYLGIGVDAIYEACAAKGLKHSKVGYSTIRIRREWLDEWMEKRAEVHT